MIRVAPYVRVSKRDSSQDVENQVVALRRYCRAHGWKITRIYRDSESGRKGRERRTSFREIFEDARDGKFDVLLVWSIDRFSREGIAETLMYMRELETYGVKLRSYREAYLNDDDSPIRSLLVAISAHAAAHEVQQLSARTKAGLEVARRRGKKLGRPVIMDKKIPRIERLLAGGYAPREIAERVGVSESSVRRYLKNRPKNISKNRVKNRR